MVRYKNRYITLEILSKCKSVSKSWNLKAVAIHEAVQKKVAELYGDLGMAAIKAGFSAKYCNANTKIALIKIRHGPHKLVLDAIPEINDLDGKTVSLKIIYVGATIKHCFIFIRNYQRSKLESLWASLRNDNERKKFEEALMVLKPDMKDLI